MPYRKIKANHRRITMNILQAIEDGTPTFQIPWHQYHSQAWKNLHGGFFNKEQTRTKPTPPAPCPAPVLDVAFYPLPKIDRFIKNTGVKIKHKGDNARHHSEKDYIQMPTKKQFIGTTYATSTTAYYMVLLHELTHWTGTLNRCNRQYTNSHYDYAFEEVIAELGAAFLCADLHVTTSINANHPSYIKIYLDKMQRYTKTEFGIKTILKAASQASKAVQYLHDLQ